MGVYSTLAEALRYPAPGRIEKLRDASLDPAVKEMIDLNAFIEIVDCMTLGEWEELYTRTLDLNPSVAPYVGFHIWGESYQRGSFMSQLIRAMREEHINLEGELPDHLVPVMEYLDAASEPMPELLSVLDKAVASMQSALRKKDKNNPYLHVFNAVRRTTKNIEVESPEQTSWQELPIYGSNRNLSGVGK